MNGEGGEAMEGEEREKERRRRKIEEDHEDGCISGERDAGSEERATSRLRLEPLK